MKNNNLLTLNKMIAGDNQLATYEQVTSWANSVLSWGSNNNPNLNDFLINIIYPTFCYSIPYHQLEYLNRRLIGLINKYKTNILNYYVKLGQLSNLQNMIQQNETNAVKENYTTDTTQDIDTNNQTYSNEATSFNPVNDGSLNATMPMAAAGSEMSFQNVANANLSNSNFNTKQNMTQDVTHSKTYTQQDFTTYNNLKIEADNVLQEILKGFYSLFYIFNPNDDKEIFLW